MPTIHIDEYKYHRESRLVVWLDSRTSGHTTGKLTRPCLSICHSTEFKCLLKPIHTRRELYAHKHTHTEKENQILRLRLNLEDN